MKRNLIVLAAFAATAAYAEPTARDVQQVLQRDFHPRGQATMERLAQDGVQRVCTETRDQPPAALAKQLEADQMKTIAFPSGSLMGDWKNGEKIAQSGRGSMWSDKPGAAAGGSCYNCHQLSPKELSHGTIGPSLLRFGKTRGNGADTQKYVYGKIYNAKAYNLCSQMPRLGHAGTLTEQQIKDLVALLLDPASPVNQ
ncbi:MAG: sulfur oxidation c-type cytochrome SoxX [Betaproteobacteria bacterium RIFCSPHIGHO2_12_FULL_69_13]|nr:MAG: sulfur oxidation c-type cytochrome SoxX [Betaproteobacteria bacterium RIFCSPHIGHO2_12_FULL_69_13]OGA71152.1 MAG: sulfur oxidation c-type cytochrome SoxX [Betaproteobacteria bacterium RIFCSPLOWO2_12_FULL_68_20]